MFHRCDARIDLAALITANMCNVLVTRGREVRQNEGETERERERGAKREID